jgi:hypothetical protein
MQRLLIFVFMFSLFSCASTYHDDVIEDQSNYKPLSYNKKKKDITKMIDKHSELNEDQKKKLKEVLVSSLSESTKLKEQESILIQQIANYSLVEEKTSLGKLNALKLELKSLYKKKYNNFESLIDKVKDIIGLDARNVDVVHDLIYLNAEIGS